MLDAVVLEAVEGSVVVSALSVFVADVSGGVEVGSDVGDEGGGVVTIPIGGKSGRSSVGGLIPIPIGSGISKLSMGWIV